MHPRANEVDRFLVNVFHKILKRESAMINAGMFSGLSLREMHVIQEIIDARDAGESTRSGDIAQRLDVTCGTLTASVKALEQKGFVLRRRDDADKRVVNLEVTPKGMEAHRLHMAFHADMVDAALDGLSEAQIDALADALSRLDAYFQKKEASGSL